MPLAKLVTFDVTGTLLFFRTSIFEKYLEIGLKHGIKTNTEALEKNFKAAWKCLNAKHPNFGKETGLGWQTWWFKMVEKTFKDHIKPEDRSKVPGIVKELIDFHTTKEAFTLRPGTEELLEFLQKQNLKLGVISNYDPRLNEILDFMNLKKYFDFVLISYDFGHSKPDRRIFEEAFRLGGCTSASEAVHVGDEVDTDYIGAKTAGMRAILISSNLEDSRIQKEDIISDFFVLKSFFQHEISMNSRTT